jgi:6-phosphofructokinase
MVDKKKIVLVTAGGHISSFHAAMKAMQESLDFKYHKKREEGFALWGARNGISGLLSGDLIPIFGRHIDENRAGSMIGADRGRIKTPEQIAAVKQVAEEKGIYTVVMMGGDDHFKDAYALNENGVPCIGYPKTMDGDLSSLITHGWDTAVSIGAKAVRDHHNTAITNRKIFYVGLFGRNTDWVPCAVGLYGGADRVIPCEREYDWDFVWNLVENSVKSNKEKFGVEFAVVPYSEGAKIKQFDNPPEKHRGNPDSSGHYKLQPEWVGMELVRLTKEKGRAAVFQAYTYSMRDSAPTETDMDLSDMVGKECMDMIFEGDFGKGVSFKRDGLNSYMPIRLPLREIAVQRKLNITSYFDYEQLLPNKSAFMADYHDLFRHSLGNPPTKKDLVYRNMSEMQNGKK